MHWHSEDKTPDSGRTICDHARAYLDELPVVAASLALGEFRSCRSSWNIEAASPLIGNKNVILSQLADRLAKEIAESGYRGCQIQDIRDCLHIQTLWPDGFRGHVIARITPDQYCAWWVGVLPSAARIADIHAMARKSDADALCNALLQQPHRIDDLDNYGDSPLHCAVSEGNLGTIKALINMGANVNLKNGQLSRGETPLGSAVSSACFHPDEPRRMQIVTLLLDAGADVNICDNSGASPVFIPACSHPTILKFLLEKGANTRTADERGWTPLHGAAFNGELDAAKLLIEHGADVNARTRDGETPFRFATKPRVGDGAAMRALLETHGADPKQRRTLPELTKILAEKSGGVVEKREAVAELADLGDPRSLGPLLAELTEAIRAIALDLNGTLKETCEAIKRLGCAPALVEAAVVKTRDQWKAEGCGSASMQKAIKAMLTEFKTLEYGVAELEELSACGWCETNRAEGLEQCKFCGRKLKPSAEAIRARESREAKQAAHLAARKEVERRQAIEKERTQQGLCPLCGGRLPLFSKLLGAKKHDQCVSYRD